MGKKEKNKKSHYIIPSLLATSSSIAAGFLLTSGILGITQGGIHEGFSIISVAFPAFGISVLAAMIILIFFIGISLYKKSLKILMPHFAGYILGIPSSLLLVIISLLLGAPLSLPFLIFNGNPKMIQPIIYCTAGIINIIILIKAIHHIWATAKDRKIKTITTHSS